MSMYNLVFGKNSKADMLLACLGITPDECGRFRDCYLTEDEIVIHTRNGGGNREDYQYVFEHLSDHPNYKFDVDDDFDCTYANIHFSFPEKHAEELKALAKESPDTSPAERWEQFFQALKEAKDQNAKLNS